MVQPALHAKLEMANEVAKFCLFRVDVCGSNRTSGQIADVDPLII